MATPREIIIEIQADTSRFIKALREASALIGKELGVLLKPEGAALSEAITAYRTALRELSTLTAAEAESVKASLREAFSSEVLAGITVNVGRDVERILSRLRALANAVGVELPESLREGVAKVQFADIFRALEEIVSKAQTSSQNISEPLIRALDSITMKLNEFGITSGEAFEALSSAARANIKQLTTSGELATKTVNLLSSRLYELEIAAKQYASQALIVAAHNKTKAESIRLAYDEIATLISRTRSAIHETRSLNLTEEEFISRIAAVSKNIRDVEAAIGDFAKMHDFAAHEVQRSRLAILSFTQIIQDLPFGLIAVANNIQQFSLAMTVLLSSGERVSNVLKILLRDLFSLRGFLIPFSVTVLTSLIVFWDRFSDSIRRGIAQLKGIREETLKTVDALRKLPSAFPSAASVELLRTAAARAESLRIAAAPTQLTARLARAGVPLPAGFIEISPQAVEASRDLKVLDATIKALTDSIVKGIGENNTFITTLARLKETLDPNALIAFSNALEESRSQAEEVSSAFGESAASAFKFASELLALKEAAETNATAQKQFAEIIKTIAPESTDVFLQTLTELRDALQASARQITALQLKQAESLRTFAEITSQTHEELRPFIDAQSELIRTSLELAAVNERLKHTTEGTREAIELKAKAMELESRLIGKNIVDTQTLTRTLANATAELERNSAAQNALSIARSRADVRERESLERIFSLRERALSLERELILLRTQAALAVEPQERRAAQARISVLQEEIKSLSQLIDLESVRIDLTARRRMLEIDIDAAEAARDFRTFAQNVLASAKAEVEFIRLTEKLSAETLQKLSDVALRRATQRILDFYQTLVNEDPFREFEANVARTVRSMQTQLSIQDVQGRSLFLITTLENLRTFEESLRESFQRAVAAVRELPETERGPLIEEIAKRFFPFKEAAIKSLEELERTFEDEIARVIVSAVQTAAPQTQRATFEMRARLLGAIRAAEFARDFELLREEFKRLSEEFRRAAAETEEAARRVYGNAIPESIQKTIDALLQLAAETENMATRIDHPMSTFFIGLDDFFRRLSDVRLFEAVNDITMNTLQLTERAMERRRQQLIESGLSEEEATRIAEKEGQKRINSMKKIARATIWIEGLAELAAISRSIATTVPWPASLALIALHTAATYARIRARLAALENIGSLSAGTSGRGREIDFGQFIQQSELPEQSPAVVRAGAQLPQPQESVVAQKLDEIKESLDRGLRITEETAARITERGTVKFAYKDPHRI